MKLKAYGKINLTLDITGKREDGFHLLDTVMQSVSVWDEVELTPGGKGEIRLRCDREYLPTDTKNTAYRAASLFFRHCGLKQEGLTISLTKEHSYPGRYGRRQRRCGGGAFRAESAL